jgi:RNA polymerase sigma-70 factor (ECF subfamily)
MSPVHPRTRGKQMSNLPETRASLLVRIRDGRDQDAWRQFLHVYGPVVYSFARKRGLQDADAADLMQDVMRSVAKAAQDLNYDPRKGTFRGWLFTVTRNRIYSFLSKERHREQAVGDTAAYEQLENLPSADGETDWDQEYQRRVFTWAADTIRSEFRQNTWAAFWQTAVEGKSPGEVSKGLGLSPGAIYVAKSRVLARLREKVQEFEDAES